MRLLSIAKKLVEWFSTKEFEHELRKFSQIQRHKQPFNSRLAGRSEESGRGQPHSRTSRIEKRAMFCDSFWSAAVLCRFVLQIQQGLNRNHSWLSTFPQIDKVSA